jgi:pyruvate dehydrogenase E2 component (dihydrolipoamide acetyltransferase)
MSDILIPQLSENVDSGTVVNIRIQAGDKVSKGDTLLELETEKAVLEVPSPETGVIQEVLVKSGDVVKVGQKVFTFSTSGATPAPELLQRTVAPEKATSATSPDRVSFLSISRKDSIGPPSDVAPPQPATTQEKAVLPSPKGAPDNAVDVAAAPSVRVFAREIGININDVTGTGPNGRILLDDVKAYAKEILTSLSEAPAARVVTEKPLPDFSKWGEITAEPMTGIRKKTAEHLSYAWTTIPHVTHIAEADITELEELRKSYSTDKAKLSILPFVIKVVVAALKNFPKFNASLDAARSMIIYKKYYNIGFAVDTDSGLLAPVIKNADKKTIFEIAYELSALAERARTRKLTIEEMQGSTFTVTNLGSIAGGTFTPIINAPEVAILGISRAQLKPGFEDGKVCAPRLMLPLCLSYDHRVIDGADGARFIKWVSDAIKQPFLLELK